jgi:hypothetical protein
MLLQCEGCGKRFTESGDDGHRYFHVKCYISVEGNRKRNFRKALG